MADPNAKYHLTTLPSDILLPVTSADLNPPSPWHNSPGLRWGNLQPPPPIGTKVTVTMNGLGTGIVASYFIEQNYLGVHVVLDDAPAWHRKQTKNSGYALVFGTEVEWDHFSQILVTSFRSTP